MAREVFELELKAKDGISGALDRIGQKMQEAGKSLGIGDADKPGTTGAPQKGIGALEEVGKSFLEAIKEADKLFTHMADTMKKVGKDFQDAVRGTGKGGGGGGRGGGGSAAAVAAAAGAGGAAGGFDGGAAGSVLGTVMSQGGIFGTIGALAGAGIGLAAGGIGAAPGAAIGGLIGGMVDSVTSKVVGIAMAVTDKQLQLLGQQTGASRITGAAYMRGNLQWSAAEVHQAAGQLAAITGMAGGGKAGAGQRGSYLTGLVRPEDSFLSNFGTRIGNLGQAAELAGGFIRYGTLGMQPGGFNRQTQQDVFERRTATGIGMTERLEKLGVYGGFTGARMPEFMSSVLGIVQGGAARGAAYSPDDVADAMSVLGKASGRLGELAPGFVTGATQAAFQAGATGGGTPQTDFLFRAVARQMGAGANYEDIQSALMGEKAGFGPMRIIKAAAEQAQLEGGPSGAVQRRIFRSALGEQYGPKAAEDIMQVYAETGISEGEREKRINAITTRDVEAAGMPGLIGDQAMVRKKMMNIEDMLLDPKAMETLELRLKIETRLTEVGAFATKELGKLSEALMNVGTATPGAVAAVKRRVTENPVGATAGGIAGGILAPLTGGLSIPAGMAAGAWLEKKAKMIVDPGPENPHNFGHVEAGGT